MKRRVAVDAIGKLTLSHKALTDTLYQIRSERDEWQRIADAFAKAQTSAERIFALELWANYTNKKERKQ